MTPRFEEYKELFKVEGKISCLVSEVFVTGPLGLGNTLALFHEGKWHSFIDEAKEKKCLEEGAALFGDPDRYERYAADFRSFIERSKAEIIPRFSSVPASFMLEEFESFMIDLKQLWYFYGLTEFSFHDGVFLEGRANEPKLKSVFEDFGKLKFEGRNVLGSFIADDGVMSNVLRSIARQAGMQPELGFFLYSDELRALLTGGAIDNAEVQKRQQYNGCVSIDRILNVFSSSEAERLWDEFHPPLPESHEVTGTVAYPGKVIGRVLIVPMLTNQAATAQIVARMKDGDILIAQSTTPELIPACKRASALVTDEGGMLSHAAVISREFKKPCVVGTKVATRVFRDGDLVEVDADAGSIRRLD